MLFDLMMIGFVELGGITELQNLNSNVVFIKIISDKKDGVNCATFTNIKTIYLLEFNKTQVVT